MPSKAENESVELAHAINRQIEHRTWGRIHRLTVEVIDGHVVVHGCTQSYYQKQLALQGVLDVIGSIDPSAIELDIVVMNDAPSTRNVKKSHNTQRASA